MSAWSFNNLQPIKVSHIDILPLMAQLTVALSKVVYGCADDQYKYLAERLE